MAHHSAVASEIEKELPVELIGEAHSPMPWRDARSCCARYAAVQRRKLPIPNEKLTVPVTEIPGSATLQELPADL